MPASGDVYRLATSDSPMSESMAMSMCMSNCQWAERQRLEGNARGRGYCGERRTKPELSSGEGDTKKVLKNSTFYALIMIWWTFTIQWKKKTVFMPFQSVLFGFSLSLSLYLAVSPPPHTHTHSLFQLFDKRCVQIKAASKMGSSSSVSLSVFVSESGVLLLRTRTRLVWLIAKQLIC